MNIDLKELETRVDKGLIKKYIDGDYIGWCYTRKCQYENNWDPYTTISRGLVTLSDGTIISRPFPKFFNLGDPQTGEIPWTETITVTEKLDGSLIIVSFHNGNMIINSKGSFKSEHVIFARKWIEENMSEWMDTSKHYSKYDIGNWTYCFEAIFPEKENIKVIQYNERADLTLLAIIHNNYDAEFDREDLQLYSALIKVKPVPHYTADNIPEIIKKCKSRSIQEGEGLVLHFSPSGKRIKVKSEEYLRLNRLMSHTSKKHILDVLINGDDIESIYATLPDEFYQEIKNTVSEIKAEYSSIHNSAERVANELRKLPTKKEQALYLLSKPELSDIKNVVFEMLEGKSGERSIWSNIRKKIKEVEVEE